MFRTALCLLTLATSAVAQHAASPAPPAAATTPVGPKTFTATAYSTKGNTVKGVETQPGIVAADPKILPLGSTIRISDAGAYSGLYVVTDIGTAIVGRKLDIYIADLENARAFGKKEVTVELLKPGDNVKFQPETTNEIPKSALAPAQKKAAAPIPSNKIPADKPAVQEGRVVHAQEKAVEKPTEKAAEKAQAAEAGNLPPAKPGAKSPAKPDATDDVKSEETKR